MESFFVALYPLVALVSFSGYVPQIIKLIRAKTPMDGISVQSWLTWMSNCCISMGYGFFHLKDLMFVATMATSFCSMTAVVGLVLYNRHLRFRKEKSGPCVKTLRSVGAV